MGRARADADGLADRAAQLIGPVLFRLALARAGEIGKMEETDTAPDSLDLCFEWWTASLS